MKLAWKTGLLIWLALALQATFAFAQGESQMTSPANDSRPQLFTGPRLLKLGESLSFELHAPEGDLRGPLVVFPRYLEQAAPGDAFKLNDSLDWVESQPKVEVPVAWSASVGKATYTPSETGSYLAKWTVGEETLYRYFAAVDDEHLVVSFSPFCPLEPTPTLHSTGLPLDYRLPADRLQLGDALCDRLLSYNRLWGDNFLPVLPDTPGLDAAARQAQYGEALSRTRALLPDPADGRSAWLECNHELDPGYGDVLSKLGVNDHCGLWCANAKPWLGMPEFPYFTSPVDCRKPCQTGNIGLVSHQWDFCGGWHFLGPVSWHFKVTEGNWSKAEKCMLQGVAEFENLTQMSGHPAFLNPLYEALDVGLGYPNPDFEIGTGEPRNFKGLVDEVFLCNRALGQTELQVLMDAGLGALEEPLAAWDFEGAGPSVTDLSGHGHQGELINGAHLAEGRRGKALALDGEDDSLAIKTALSVDTTDFSMGCWVIPGAEQRQYANLLSSHNAGGNGPFRGISFEQDSTNANRFHLIAGDGTGWYISDNVQLEAGRWQHLAAVREGRRLSLYLDGQLAAENELPSEAPFPQATEGLRIGDWVRGTPDAARAKQFLDFVERYQRFIAFELPKSHKLVFARSQDVADYFRRHFVTTPRTVFSSKTDHATYDIWWTYQWDMNRYFMVTRERLPWLTRVLKVPRIGYKDPLSYEFLLIEDSRWSIRFERECPHPIWRFDYRVQERTDEGSAVLRTELPDVYTPVPKWERDGEELVLRLRLTSPASFEDYALCVWALPPQLDTSTLTCPGTKELVLANNTDGERHVVLFFDLKPSMTLELRGKAL